MIGIPKYNINESRILGVNGDWSHESYRIKDLHNKGYKGDGIKVAVLDTGIDLNHLCFQEALDDGRIIANISDRYSTFHDGHGHGSWCASRYIGTNNVIGFCPNCILYSYKVMNDNGSGSLDDVFKYGHKALDEGVKIISISLGWNGEKGNKDLVDLVNRANSLNACIVAAAGNDFGNGLDLPALEDGVLSVGSHDVENKRSEFSDIGIDLELYGPGDGVLGAWKDGRVLSVSGTSMAAPSVGAFICLVYDYVMNKYGKFDYEILKKITKCH